MDVSQPLDMFYRMGLALVREAGEIARESVAKQKTVDLKSCDVDLVTETDQQIEKLLISSLSEVFPSHKFIGEESVADGKPCELTDNPTWIIDPVDGTMNFVHGYPFFCISVALWINKQPYIGIIYNPVLEQLFTAQRGKGAFLNGKKIKVSSERELNKSLLAMEFGTSRDPEKCQVVMENITKLVPLVHGCRSSGCAALNSALVASGATECYFEFGIHAWDVAAAWLLVQEAGGVVLDPAGGEPDLLSRRILFANKEELARNLIPHIKQFYPERDYLTLPIPERVSATLAIREKRVFRKIYGPIWDEMFW